MTSESPIRSDSPKSVIPRVGEDDVNMKESIPPSRVLGVFGMSLFTRRDDLERIFREFGPIERAEIIMNRQTGRSKGFGFVYFEKLEDAEVARLKTNGLTINERQIRVDFSRTEAPHTPTPGFYNGKPIEEVRRERGTGSGDRYRSRSDHHHDSQRRSYRPASSSDIDGDRRYVPSRNRSRSRSNSRERNRQGKFRSDQRQNDYRPRHRSISRDRRNRNN